jgi:hypothetical protein
MGRISESCLAVLARNSLSATACFGIPAQRVVELGMQIDLEVATSQAATRVSWVTTSQGGAKTTVPLSSISRVDARCGGPSAR